MRSGIIVLASIVCLALCTTTAASAAADKFAYVDLSKLFDEYKKTQEFDKVLEGKQTTFEKEREEKVEEVKNLQDKMNLLSDKEKEAKKGDLEDKIKQLQEFDRVKGTDLRKERDEKMREILKDIEKAIADYSKRNAYTMVFNDRVLVYQDKSLDITDEVLKVLQGYYKK